MNSQANETSKTTYMKALTLDFSWVESNYVCDYVGKFVCEKNKV